MKRWHKEERKNYTLIVNEGGENLGIYEGSGVELLEVDGWAFKDLNHNGVLDPYEDWRRTPEERAEDLAGRLSVEEIAGLMCFTAHQVVFDPELTEEQRTFLDLNLRSVLNSGGLVQAEDAPQVRWANALQRYVEGKGHGIPCYIASDPRNGIGVSDWPVNLSLAASFDPGLAREAAMCQSRELRDLGVTCFLAPQVDVGSDPRWYRFSGTFGEDPALSRDLARAFCDGLQSTYDEEGRDLGWGKDSVAAMVKHWTGEGAGEGGREAHLPGGKYAVYPGGGFEALMTPFTEGAFRLEGKTGCVNSVMSSYTIAYTEDGSLGELEGSSFSEYKIKTLLRERFGFAGSVCTDWQVLNEGTAPGPVKGRGWGIEAEKEDQPPEERALKALLIGVDQMGGCSNPQVLLRTYALGCERIGEEDTKALFRASAARLLLGYFRTGLFENPYIDEEACLRDVNNEEKQHRAMEAQLRTIVMLKNEKGTVRPHSRRLKVYLPAFFEAEHLYVDHRNGMLKNPARTYWPILPQVAEKHFDVVTDRVEGTKITRLTAEELEGVDLVLIPAKCPVNVFQQDGRDLEGNFIPQSLQYRPYKADGPHVRRVSLAGDPLPDGGRENRSYYGRSAILANPEVLDQVLELAGTAKKAGIPSVLAMFTGQPLCFHELEPFVDAILVTFSMPSLYGGGSASAEALAIVAAGLHEPTGLLPCQMPRDMDAVEAQLEDIPRDMECYTDSVGHTYDFGFGMDYSGPIRDARTERYSRPPLTEPQG